MKIIFLDIDGVLNSELTINQRNAHYIKTGELISDIDEEKVILLKEIIELTDAKVVLASSWRDSWVNNGNAYIPTDEHSKLADKIFDKYNICIYSITPNINQNRPKEIRTWIDEQSEEIKCVILDDDFFGFQYKKYNLSDFLIHTSFYGNNGGLTRKHVKQAIKILNDIPTF